MSSIYNSYISCPKGIEPLLKAELQDIGDFGFQKQHVGGLSCNSRLIDLYNACLWSRLANRVLLRIGEFSCKNKESLRDELLKFAWHEHMCSENTVYIRFFGQIEGIQHTQYGARFVKDVIVDYFRDIDGKRPGIKKQQPDLRFQINVFGHTVNLYLDMSGDSLHMRGYRQGNLEAPLKENLAAALLIRADWPAIANQGGSLIDTFCGSGTILAEAALIAGNVAPGLLKQHFGFNAWRLHDEEVWQATRREALTSCKKSDNAMVGYDKDSSACDIANTALHTLHTYTTVPRVYNIAIHEWEKDITSGDIGLLISNPPYGKRLQEAKNLSSLYQEIGGKWQSQCPGWQAAIFTNDDALMKSTRLYWNKEYKFLNGPIECKLYLLDLEKGLKQPLDEIKKSTSGVDIQPFTDRIKKNQKRLLGWIKQNNIECYRVYNADMPEFAVVIDIYKDHAVVQEYQAPDEIDTRKANKRLNAVMTVLPSVLDIAESNIVYKKRSRQKTLDRSDKTTSRRLQVNEGEARIWVELEKYLDSGLFLDHRPLRVKLSQICKGKQFLNLFCYTAVATVHAALGGAESSVSVDMSKTYLDWADRNFTLNAIDTSRHRLVQANAMDWLVKCKQQFDIIFLDPPTFSNSKSMNKEMDIQRDHVELINSAARCLRADGTLYFSTNRRRFRLDRELTECYDVSDITAWSIPRDFTKAAKIHYCYEIKFLSDQ